MKNTRANYKNMNTNAGEKQNIFNEKKQGDKSQVIELEKDQYKVE